MHIIPHTNVVVSNTDKSIDDYLPNVSSVNYFFGGESFFYIFKIFDGFCFRIDSISLERLSGGVGIVEEANNLKLSSFLQTTTLTT